MHIFWYHLIVKAKQVVFMESKILSQKEIIWMKWGASRFVHQSSTHMIL